MTNKLNSGYYLIILITIAVVWLAQLIKNYNVRNSQDQYGISYNKKRRSLGIPIIPPNWHVKERDPEFIWWTGNEKDVGHKRKTIAFSGGNIKSEYDVYTLPVQNGKARWLEIQYDYNNRPQKDSVIYTYQIDHTAREISKNIADSLLNAGNINKDY